MHLKLKDMKCLEINILNVDLIFIRYFITFLNVLSYSIFERIGSIACSDKFSTTDLFFLTTLFNGSFSTNEGLF